MNHTARGRTATFAATVFGIEALAFFLLAAVHLGVRMPMELAAVAQPQIAAALVALLGGFFLDGAAYATLTRKTKAWRISIAAHVFGIIGILLNDRVLAPTDVNEIYRLLMAVVALVGLLLMTTKGKAALGHQREGYSR